MMVINPKGKYIDESAYDFSAASKDCEDCHSTGIQGYAFDRTGKGSKTPIICHCVPRKKLNGKAVS